MSRILEFDEWYDENEQDITCAAAESGADREFDYDSEQFEIEMYENYLAQEEAKRR